MRQFTSTSPRQQQENILAYLRSGLIYGLPMGGRVRDPFDRTRYADAFVDGECRAGCTILIDGVWFWYAGLIYFVENYNIRLPDDFIAHAERQAWHVDRDAIPTANYENPMHFVAAT